MLEALVIERFTDGTDPPIHHVAGSNQIRTGSGLHHRLLAEQLDGFVVEHHPLLTDDAVMSIAGIGIKRDIRHDRHLGKLLLQLADGTRNQAVLVEALGAVFGFEFLRHLGEEHHAADAEIPGPLHFAGELVKAPAIGTRHGTDRLHICTLMHKEGIDEIGRRQPRLPDHGTQCR